FVEGTAAGTRYTGDHINALCRAIARNRLRENSESATTPADVERALTEWIDRPKMTTDEERVVAIHEAGHAVVNLFCKHAKPIERISIVGDAAGALGFVQYQDPAHRYVVTRGQLLDDLCILMGGREAEALLLDDISIGSAGDIARATDIARALVEEFGMGGDDVGLARYGSDRNNGDHRRDNLSAEQLKAIDHAIRDLLDEARQRASAILTEHQPLVEVLRDELLKHKTLDSKGIAQRREEIS
ncbi:MAG: hypothetical protein KDA81_19945, partial [Planctomycetaceae bacterium]|nr:hypothetical protein [Planctomycetaceae bacterium]